MLLKVRLTVVLLTVVLLAEVAPVGRPVSEALLGEARLGEVAPAKPPVGEAWAGRQTPLAPGVLGVPIIVPRGRDRTISRAGVLRPVGVLGSAPGRAVRHPEAATQRVRIIGRRRSARPGGTMAARATARSPRAVPTVLAPGP